MSQRFTIARITRAGEHFEILVKPEPALSYRTGKINSVSKVLATETVFTDANKGLRASEDQLQKAFGTSNTVKIADVILKSGSLQLTTEQRKKMTENKRKQIVSFITRQCVDPKTNLPHPPLRIEKAMEQVSVAVRIPPEYAGRVYGTVKGFGTIKKEEWKADGSWFTIVEMPAGLYGSFLEKLGEMTKGNLEAKLMK